MIYEKGVLIERCLKLGNILCYYLTYSSLILDVQTISEVKQKIFWNGKYLISQY